MNVESNSGLQKSCARDLPSLECGRRPAGGSGEKRQAIDVADGEDVRGIKQRQPFLIEAIAGFTGQGALFRRNLNSGSRVGKITAQIDVLAEGIGGAKGQAARQSLFGAGLSGVVMVDAVA